MINHLLLGSSGYISKRNDKKKYKEVGNIEMVRIYIIL